MKKIIYIFTLLLIVIACDEPKKQSVMLVKPTVFYEKMAEQKGKVVDVRTPEEYKGGHLKEAVNIHLYDKDFEQRIEELDKEKPVYIYCKVGGRSAEAVKIMEEKGFNSIVELEGGIDAWTQAKKPITK